MVGPFEPGKMREALQFGLADSGFPVERDAAALLSESPLPAEGETILFYGRKVELTKKLQRAYAERGPGPTDPDEISSLGYLAFALLFHEASLGISRGLSLKFSNSAFRCLEKVEASPGKVALQGAIEAAVLLEQP